MANMLFWFSITPTGPNDPVRTIVTRCVPLSPCSPRIPLISDIPSMAAVLTTTMTMRIILSVRGTLVNGGSYAVTSSSHPSRSGGTSHVISTNRVGGGITNPVLSINQSQAPAPYSVPLEAEQKSQDWPGEYDQNSVGEGKEGILETPAPDAGVTITIEAETVHDPYREVK